MPLPAIVIGAAEIIAIIALATSVAVPYTSNTMSDDDAWQQVINLLNRIRAKKPHNVHYVKDPYFVFIDCDHYYHCTKDLTKKSESIDLYFVKHFYKSNELFIDDGSGLTKANPRDWLGALREQYAVAARQASNANSVPA